MRRRLVCQRQARAPVLCGGHDRQSEWLPTCSNCLDFQRGQFGITENQYREKFQKIKRDSAWQSETASSIGMRIVILRRKL